jgi:RNA polymerase sigma factor (TIGR02999 family)
LNQGGGVILGEFRLSIQSTHRQEELVPSPEQVTRLLQAWSKGEESALEKLLPLVHRQLHRLAHKYMKGERTGHTLQTTALVNEAYVRLLGYRKVNWKNRIQFFAISARLMRRILVDAARERISKKRGGGAEKIVFDELLVGPSEQAHDLVALDDALKALAEVDPRKSQVVELRFFGGMTGEEIAKLLKVSPDTVLRDWRLAKAWLKREMTKEKSASYES